jgi:hypothetical protein
MCQYQTGVTSRGAPRSSGVQGGLQLSSYVMSLSCDARLKIVTMIDVMEHDMTIVQMVYITYFNALPTTVKRPGNERFCAGVSTGELPTNSFPLTDHSG